jgi:hypothetical protein
MVQDLCVWDRALSESDVLALYSKGFLRTPSPGHGRTAGSTVAATVFTFARLATFFLMICYEMLFCS